jgi:Uma2 family endonuclease
VLSKGNTKPEMNRKIREYFEAGVRVVWIIDRKKRSARVYSAPGQSILVRADQALDGGDVLPGLVVPLGDLFDSIRRRRKS